MTIVFVVTLIVFCALILMVCVTGIYSLVGLIA